MNLNENLSTVSSIPVETLSFKFAGPDATERDKSSCESVDWRETTTTTTNNCNSNDTEATSALVSEKSLWNNIFNNSSALKSGLLKEIQCFSQINDQSSQEGSNNNINCISAAVSNNNGFGQTLISNQYKGNIESSEPETVYVNTRDLKYSPRTVLILHPLLPFGLDNRDSSLPIRCYLPTKRDRTPQIYRISRNLETPEQVDVILDRDLDYSQEQGVGGFLSSLEGVLSESLSSSADHQSSLIVPNNTNGVDLVLEAQVQPSSDFAGAMMTTSTPAALQNTIVSTDDIGRGRFQGNDKTHPGESSRPGYVTVCHNCGVESNNFQTCDRCKRTIPQGTRIRPDPYGLKSAAKAVLSSDSNRRILPQGSKIKPDSSSNNHNSKSAQQAVLDSVYPKKANLAKFSIPLTKKRAAKKKAPKEECITLSSDEEEMDEAAATPEKRPKLEEDDEDESETGEHSTQDDKAETPGEEKDKTVVDAPADGSFEAKKLKWRAEFQKTLADDQTKIEEAIALDNFKTISCRSFRVGTHKRVWKEPFSKADFTVYVCDHGVRFLMPHVVTPCKKVQIIIPKHSTLNVSAHLDNRKLSYLIFRVGNKIACYIRETLGITRESVGTWFDPSQGQPWEQNIVFMVEEFSEGCPDYIKALYKNDLNVLDQAKANSLLVHISPPQEGTSNCRAGGGDGYSVGRSPRSSNSPARQELNSKESKTGSNVSASAKRNDSKVTLRSHTEKAKNGKLPPGQSKTDGESFEDENKQILKWPSITLHQADLVALRPEQFLNDQILDFWLLYVHKKLLGDADRERTHIFSTYFYTRLTTKPKSRSCPAWENDKSLSAAEKRHRRVKKWTKNVDIFSKDFIVVPINDNCHWFLAVICFPGLDGPHWMDDGSPIVDWQNIIKGEKSAVQYTLPPGMPPPEKVKKPPKKKKKAEVKEELPDLEANAAETNGVASGKEEEEAAENPTPSSQGSDTTTTPTPVPAAAAAAATPSTPTTAPPVITTTTTLVVSSGTAKTFLAKIVKTSDAKGVGGNRQTVSTISISAADFAEFEDPYKDEADDDPEEASLVQQYNCSESEDSENLEDELDETTEKEPTASEKDDTVTDDTVKDGTVKEETVKEEEVKVKEEADVKPDIKVEPKQEALDPEAPAPRTDFRIKQPCILIFNSLPMPERKNKVFTTLRDYLRLEYKERKGQDKPFTKIEMPGAEPRVPLQSNYCDCGIYVLEYVEKFFSDPLPTFLLPQPKRRNWFPQLKTKRKDMYNTICDLVKSVNPENVSLIPKFEVPLPPVSPPKSEKTAVSSQTPSENSSAPAAEAAAASAENSTPPDDKTTNSNSSDNSSSSPDQENEKSKKVEVSAPPTLEKVNENDKNSEPDDQPPVLTRIQTPKVTNKKAVVETPKKPEIKAEPTTKILLKSQNLTDTALLQKVNKQLGGGGTPPLGKTVKKTTVYGTLIRSSNVAGKNSNQNNSTTKPPQNNITTSSASPGTAGKNNNSTAGKNNNSTPKRPNILKTAKAVKIPAAQVEAAPRQTIQPVVPGEEPMDIDPQ